MSQNILDLIAHRAIDPRADGATRFVHVNATSVTIERSLQGVRMRVGVPVSAYRGLVLAVRHACETATLVLRHDDSDLDVALGNGDVMELAHKAKGWSDLLGQPITIEDAGVTMRPSLARRTKRATPKRRSSFARRRKAGCAGRMENSFAHEHEIIARN